MRVLNDLVALSTVTLQINEIRDYTPMTAEAPGFGTRVGRAWTGTWSTLFSVIQGAVVLVVMVTPWLIVGAMIGLAAWRLVRRKRRNRVVATV